MTAVLRLQQQEKKLGVKKKESKSKYRNCFGWNNGSISPQTSPSELLIYAIFPPQSGQFSEDMIPTVGFNMRKVTKGNVTIKVWSFLMNNLVIQEKNKVQV